MRSLQRMRPRGVQRGREGRSASEHMTIGGARTLTCRGQCIIIMKTPLIVHILELAGGWSESLPSVVSQCLDLKRSERLLLCGSTLAAHVLLFLGPTSLFTSCAVITHHTSLL